MDFNPIDLILHLDTYLAMLVSNYGVWIYAILFLVIFCETGLVVTPFLPGDSLLFIAGDTRDMLPHSRVMVHDPLISGGVGGSALSVKARADDLMRIRDITAQVIAQHSGMDLEQVFEITARDTYFEAEDAVAAHLADRVINTL